MRGFDPENRRLYIITPVPQTLLINVNTILKGDLEISTQILTQSGLTSVPYMTSNALKKEGSGSAPMETTRGNLLRSSSKPFVN